jgi:hypothetical protein
MKPSEYMNRNLRVSPFHFEDVGHYFDRYPQVSNVYSFSSDFPHREGGKWTKRTYQQSLAHHSPETARKFFHDNGPCDAQPHVGGWSGDRRRCQESR